MVADGLQVRGTYRRSPPPVAGVEWLQLEDLASNDACLQAVAGCDSVVHLAALAHQTGRASSGRWPEFFRTNVAPTRCLARASRTAGVRRFVFLSSIAAVCAYSDSAIDEETPCAPPSEYGRSKLEAERALQQELSDGSTDWCILRSPLVYGPGNPGNMSRILRLIASGLPLPFGAIENRRSFIYIDNLVDALVVVRGYAATLRATYMLSDGSDFATRDLARALAAARGVPIRMISVPAGILRWVGRAGDVVGRITGANIGIDSYSVDKLLGSLTVNGERFRERFAWRPPVAPGDAMRMTSAAEGESRGV